MKTITVKTWPVWFDLTITRKKDFEIRKDDRDYQEGDILRQREFDPEKQEYSGRVAVSRITCALRNLPGLMPGYVLIGAFFVSMEADTTKKTEE